MDNLPLVLVVEDDKPSLEVLKIFLADLLEHDHVATGTQAVKMAKSKKYAGIIMDINLGPGMSGLDAVTEIRKLPGYEHTPILALTAYAMLGDRENFLRAGCTHYLSKPYSKSELMELINEMIH